MRTPLLVCLIACLTANAVAGDQAPSATDLVERAIAHHDPDGLWGRVRLALQIRETRPDGSERATRILIDDPNSAFEILTRWEDATTEGFLAGDDCLLTLDGSTEFTAEQRDKYKLTCERLRWLRDYYTYLWGLPMKLRDPGTRIEPETEWVEFQGRPVWSVRVTYDASVGSDTWYFYFTPDSGALVGYRFFHDESAGDGEYIVLDGEIESGGLRIPARRSWYSHQGDRYLGDDILESLQISH